MQLLDNAIQLWSYANIAKFSIKRKAKNDKQTQNLA